MLNPETIDFKQLGFHAGIEVHHQIRSDRKLFCHCPPDLEPDPENMDYTFYRYFRPVLGEMGDFDPGMLVEFEKGYKVIYYACEHNTCTYEMDETPPFPPDHDAIRKGFILAHYFNCSALAEEIVVNRKQYLDGSITTGFQRTFITGRDGWVPVFNKKVHITNVHIEEDAARRVNWCETADRTVYFNLDRLGVPLTEVITNHRDIDTPEELVELAKQIGRVLRVSRVGRRGPRNILYAARVAGYENFAEVTVCMHGGTSDSYNLIHRAVRCRKMHSSRRDTFRTLDDIPLGKIDETGVTWFKQDIHPRTPGEDFILDTKIDTRVGMLYSYPSMNPDILDSMIDKGYHGIVIIGTGLGHVGTDMFPPLERCQQEEIPVVLVVEPLFGYIHLRVYETGRDMLSRGVIEGANMLPSAAYTKLIWVLGHTRNIDEVKQLMQTNIAGEITEREGPRGFLLLQGVEPGINTILDNL